MAIAVWCLLLVAAFVGCQWSGRMLDSHYNDRFEIGAVLVVAMCVFVPILFSTTVAAIGGPAMKVTLGMAVCGGLLFGRNPAV